MQQGFRHCLDKRQQGVNRDFAINRDFAVGRSFAVVNLRARLANEPACQCEYRRRAQKRREQ